MAGASVGYAGDAGEWDEVLAALAAQLELVVGDAFTAQGAGSWSPPGRIGPIPARLEGRARQLLAAQRAVIDHLQQEQRVTGKHLRMVRAVPQVLGAGSVYLDTES
jgi:hypothetical protein